MDFTSLGFLGYAALAAIINRLSPPSWRATILLCFSYLFYCTWSAQMALLLLGATAAAYFAALGIESFQNQSAKRATLFSVISLLTLIVAVYKAAPFLHNLFGWNLLLPLGISYYTFKLISYVVDVSWGKTRACHAFVPFAAYVAFFPQIVAGPIQRSESFLPQIEKPVSPSLEMAVRGIQRILLGYFKKFLVADNLAPLVNLIYAHLHSPGVPVVMAFYAYPLQIYADFSGLTDIANGTALLFGIAAPENFNAPFSASSPSQYWRRWHMTLTLWLTDYVFTPLHWLSRSLGNAGLVFSLLVNMVLIGLWHGFRWTYALFGVLHAIYLSADALSARWRRRYFRSHPTADTAANWLGPVLTFHLIGIGFVFFRANSVGDVLAMLGRLAQNPGTLSPEFLAFWSASGRGVLIGIAAFAIAEMIDAFRRRTSEVRAAELPRWERWAAYSCTATALLVTVCLMLVGGAAHNPFLYAIF